MLRFEDEKELNEINVTPFIDIMLVLLVIFMVVAPLITSSVEVELPKASQSQKQDEQKLLILYINQNELSLNEQKTELSEIGSLLDEKTQGNKEQEIYFFVDKSVEYKRLVEVMNVLKSAGYRKIALSTELASE